MNKTGLIKIASGSGAKNVIGIWDSFNTLEPGGINNWRIENLPPFMK